LIPQQFDRQPLGWPIRSLLVVAAAGLAGLLILARMLEPDPRGFGTHVQLGLRPCAFLTATGRLCPSCGMTTSYAWLARGQIDRSWKANPAGCIYALLSVPLIFWMVSSAIANQPVGFQSLAKPLAGLLFAAVFLGLMSWLIRLIVSPAVLVGDGGRLGTLTGLAGL
jgi:Protein of unknown function (DUF2752)